MRTGIIIELNAADRSRLEAIAADRNSPQKHVWRTRVVLLSAEGVGTNEVMRQTRVAKTCVWRWQERFMNEGVDGLLRDKTRPARIAPLSGKIVSSIVSRTLEKPPGETTHWTAPAMAKAVGVSVSSVQRVWRKHGLQPHRIRQFKLSNDERFAEKLRDVVGLYVAPPAQMGTSWPFFDCNWGASPLTSSAERTESEHSVQRRLPPFSSQRSVPESKHLSPACAG
jgi:transposase